MNEDQKQQPQAVQKTVEEDMPEVEIDRSADIDKTYDIEGFLGGGAAGLLVGIIVSFDAIFAMEIGMFVGLIVGTRFKKEKKAKDTAPAQK